MELTNRQLFAQVLCEAMAKEYNDELENCTESAECSLSHYRKMSKILGYNVVPKSKRVSSKSKFVIAVLAAALLLAGCTAVIFRNEIKRLFEEVFDTFVSATYDKEFDGKGGEIAEYYKPTYLPKNYTLLQETKTPMFVYYKYEDDESNILIFRQNLLEGYGYAFDRDNKGTIIFEDQKKRIYYYVSEEYNNYVWTDGIYAFNITSKHEIQINELKMIVDGVSPQWGCKKRPNRKRTANLTEKVEKAVLLWYN